MLSFQRILIPTDFSMCAEAAYRQGLFLAQQYGADVHFLHVTSPTDRHGLQSQHEWPTWIEAAGTSDYDRRWRDVLLHRVRVAHEDPAATILDYARVQDIDLIVIGAHGDRGEKLFMSQGIDQAFLGRTAEQVMRHASCPVVKVMMRGGGNPGLVRRLLVPYDGSSLASLALAYGRDLAARYEARLDVLHVIEQAGSRRQEGAEDEESRIRADLIEAFKQTPGPVVSAGFHVSYGDPVRVIRAFVRRYSVDMVIQGAHSDAGRDMLGVVAAEVARTAPCSTLIMRALEQVHTPRHFTEDPFSGNSLNAPAC